MVQAATLPHTGSHRGHAADVLRRFVDRIKTDRRFYFKHCLQIKTKNNRIIPFELNFPQNKVQKVMDDMRKKGLPVRIIILKARQEGMSTLTEANIFHDTSLFPYTNSMIVAHDTDSSYEIFSMSRLFYDVLDPEIKPMTRYSNRKELVFENPDDTQKSSMPGLLSKLVVDTAANAKIGRAFTIHHFHGSEVAFWEKPDAVMLGVNQAVPDQPNTSIILESTANGLGGFFYDAYMAAKEGRSDYVAVFIPWFDLPDYSRPITIGDWDEKYPTFRQSLESEELELITKYHLSLEQINWRRWAIRNKCGTGTIEARKELFRQEYPSNDAECFLVSGQTVFNGRIIKDVYLVRTNEPERGYLKLTDGGIRFEENDHGPIAVWDPPTQRETYVVGADVAEGLAHRDASTGQVYARRASRFTAEYWGHLDPDLFGQQLWLLGMWYNEAWLAVENNFHGLSTLLTLRNGSEALQMTVYPYLFYHERIDERTRRKTRKLGWLTNGNTKPVMIDALVQLSRDLCVEIPNKELLREMLTYVKDKHGKMGAISGCLDDRVIAASIAVQTHGMLPMVRSYKQKRATFQHRRKRTGY